MEKSWIGEACDSVWKKISLKVKHAVVFMDFSCAECLFWSGGPMKLISAGSLDIKDFSSFEGGSKKQKKAVFIVSTILKGKTLSILEDIITASHFDYCVIITTVDAETHKIAYASQDQDGGSIFRDCEEKVCMWMGNMNYTCEILYIPLFIAPFTNMLYLTPSLNHLFPLMSRDLLAINQVRKSRGEKQKIERLSDIHFFSLPINYQLQLKVLAGFFNNLFEILNCKDELFAVGHTSRLLATQLANLPSARQRRKVAMNTASLLIIDRSLDTVQAAQHSNKSLVDKILGILPELPGHCNNISVDMLKLTNSQRFVGMNINVEEMDAIRDVVVCPGCLSPPDDACPLLLEDMIKLSEKEALKLIKRHLLEACIEEGIDSASEDETKSFSDDIYHLVANFNGNSGAIMYHNNLLQLSMAAAETISHDFNKKWKEICRMETLLLLEEDPIMKVCEIINNEDEDGKRRWNPEDILSMLVYICSLRDISTSDEVWDDLSSSLSLMLSECNLEQLPEGLYEALGMNPDEGANEVELDLIQDVVEEIMEKLKGLHTLSCHSQHLNILSQQTFGPPTYEPLLGQLMRRIVDSSQPDLNPEVEHVSTGLMDLLKSGFSMFKKISPPRPNDAGIMFIFVIGGITLEETRIIHKIIEDHNSSASSKLQVIIGSTRLVSTSDVIDKLLFANNLSPDDEGRQDIAVASQH